MNKERFQLAPQCKMMRICGVDIIGNPQSNTVIGLDEEGIAFVEKLRNCESIDFSRLSENELLLYDELYQSGFFENEKEYTVKSAYLHVTSHCNLTCPGCYSYEKDRNSIKDLPIDKLKEVLDNLERAGLVNLTISGGEPFFRDDLGEILKYAREKRQIEYIECITNGTAPYDRYRSAFEFLDKLTFSLDSADETSAIIRSARTFDIVKERIIELKEDGFPVSIVFTVHHGNVKHINKLMQFAASLGVESRFSLLTVDEFNCKTDPLVLTKDDYNFICDYLSNGNCSLPIGDVFNNSDIGCVDSCGAGKTMVAIASNGDILPCHMFLGREDYVMGNALQVEIKDTVNCPNSNVLYSINVDTLDKCSKCDIRYVCGGGCRYRSLCKSGNTLSTDPMCSAYRIDKENIIRRLAGVC